MKRIILFLCVIFLICFFAVVSVSASDDLNNGEQTTSVVSEAVECMSTADECTILDSGQCGENLFWELDSNGLLRIFGEGPMYDYNKYYEPSPWYKYREEPYISESGNNILDKNGQVYLSTKGYYEANPNGYKVKEILIEEGITYIGDWAFYRVCVEEITVPETVEATGIFCFRYSPTLRVLNLPDSLKVLDDFAISRNYDLEIINIGNSLETVGVAGFNHNTSLKKLVLPDTCTAINKQLSPSYSDIDYTKVGLLENCSSLEYVSFGSVTEIPQRTCLGAAIETVIIPNTVESIGDYAFYSCKNLKTVVFEEGSVCKSIGNNTFSSCESLKSVTGGIALEKLGLYTSMTTLEEFDFSATNKEFQKGQFLGTSLRKIEVSKNITVIPLSCFNSMKCLEEIYLPGTLTEIKASSFNYCLSLTDVYFDGTRAQWGAIKKATGWEYKINSGCKLHFSDGTSVSLWYTPVKYTVTFKDYDGTVLLTKQISEGCDATAPEPPERAGYIFTGWDNKYTFVTENIVVTAQYRRNNGTMKVDVNGGAGFTVSVNNGTAKPQGSYYVNSTMPIGILVTVSVPSYQDKEFIGWLNADNNSILTEELSYTFRTSGRDNLKAVFRTPIDDVCSVMFKNDKQHRIIDIQYYVSGDEIIFPDAPFATGYDFDGWDHTEEEIQAKLLSGEDVIVVAKWKVKPVYFSVTVNGGEVLSHGGLDEEGNYLAYRAVMVEAQAPESGLKFAYWTDKNSKIKSYESTYKFYPAEDTELTAVYVAEETEIDYQVLVDVVIDTTYEEKSNNIIFSWSVPEEKAGFTFVQAGILLVNEQNYDELTFEIGTQDTNVKQYSPNIQYQLPTNAYSVIQSNVNSGDAWVVKAWVQYYDAQGELREKYSDVVIGKKP